MKSHACQVEEYNSLSNYLFNQGTSLFGDTLSSFRHLEAKILYKQPKHGPIMAPTWPQYGPNNSKSKCIFQLAYFFPKIGPILVYLHIWMRYIFNFLGPCFGYLYNIFASRCRKWLKFSLEVRACQIEEYNSMSNYWDHMIAMLGPCLGHIRAMF